ncbi:hypothetical protein GCM10027170_37510 [Aliiglaciecola aliphaticivorans]
MLIGALETMNDVKHWVDRLNCHASEIVELDKLNTKRKKHYLVKNPGVGNYEKGSFSF